MSTQARALLIAMLGPALQAVGVAWDLLDHAVFERAEVGHLTLTHILTGPAHLLIFTGMLVSIVCIPIALQVSAARPEDLELPHRAADDEALIRSRLDRVEPAK